MPKKQLRLPGSTWPLVASRWLHVRPAQQPSEATAKERAPMTTSASGGVERLSRGRIARSPGWRRVVKKWKSQHCTCCWYKPRHDAYTWGTFLLGIFFEMYYKMPENSAKLNQ